MGERFAEMIDGVESLAQLADEVRGCDLFAIDTEADSLHRYRESLCLIQFAWNDQSILIDPLAIEQLDSLAGMIREATVWMHGADYDMSMLLREFGELPKCVFDTQIGARLLGVRKFGLGNLVEHYFGVVLSKSSQKADWGKRPLSPKMIDYALNDVRYLLPMAEKIVAGLKERDRFDWFVESCEFAKLKVEERHDEQRELWRIQGSGKLNSRELNVLWHLWEWRDGEAKEWNKPSFMVATNRVLLEWSQAIARGETPHLPKHYRRSRRERFHEALAKEKSIEEKDYPEKIRMIRRRRSQQAEKQINELLSRRKSRSAELDLEPSLLGSRAMIEAWIDDSEAARSQWMDWQIKCLGLDD